MYRAMRAKFGPRRWWPSIAGCRTAEGKLEICLGAILTQNTAWGNVEKALHNLRQNVPLTVEDLHALPPAELARLLRPAGYFNVKTRRVRSFLSHVRQRWNGNLEAMLAQPIAALREELLNIHGIGRETADSMILYAAGQASFVVDAYTSRIFRRHGLLGPKDDYETIRAFFQDHLPRSVRLWNDYHAQIVETGKHFCKPVPRCEGCPLRRFRRATGQP